MAIWKKKNQLIEYDKDDDILSKLASINGIEDLQSWLKPSEEDCFSPYSLENISEAVDKIIDAINRGLNITTFGDIDSDGITSLVMIVGYLRKIVKNPKLIKFTHAQRSEGHGIETMIDQEFPETDLLIIVDSSTNSVDGCGYFVDLGMDIIVLDHHPSNVYNPYALIVNPQMCDYGNKELSGAGVVYKVLQVLDDKLNEDYAFEFIDLAGLGIYGDVMSMAIPENRWFVYNSLKNVTNYGLQALLKNSGIFDLKATDYGFTIVPIVNACARLDKIELIIELLLCDNPEDAKELAKQCIKLNKLRKKMQKELSDELIPEVDPSKKVSIIITNKSSKGFNGLIATNVAEKFQRPCLIMTHTKSGMVEGSVRSYNDFDLRKFLDDSGLFEYCSGHGASFGVGFKFENLEKIDIYIQEQLDVKSFEQKENVIYYDLEIDDEDITEEFIKKVAYFNFVSGKGFREAKFLIKNYTVEERKLLGANEDTIKLTGARDLIAMKFKTNSNYADETEFSSIDMIGTLNINKWYHRGLREWVRNNQIFMEDFRYSE